MKIRAVPAPGGLPRHRLIRFIVQVGLLWVGLYQLVLPLPYTEMELLEHPVSHIQFYLPSSQTSHVQLILGHVFGLLRFGLLQVGLLGFGVAVFKVTGTDLDVFVCQRVGAPRCAKLYVMCVGHHRSLL